jgi:NADH dehydrogenase FAD-containing subunit
MGEHFVVVGGGVCGVTCCQTLAAEVQGARAGARTSSGRGGDSRVTLVAAAGLLKGVANVVRLSRHLDSFDVVEEAFDAVAGPQTEVVEGEAASVDTASKVLTLRDGRRVPYDKLCICSGARPKVISDNPRVLTLRDTASAQLLRDKLQSARRVLITGNGGIAMELVHEITNCQLVWVVREGHMGNAFFDQDAAQFLAPAISSRLMPSPTDPMAAYRNPTCSVSGPPSTPCPPLESKSSAADTLDDDVAADGDDSSQPQTRVLIGSSPGPQWMHASLSLAFSRAEPRVKHGFGLFRGAIPSTGIAVAGPSGAGRVKDQEERLEEEQAGARAVKDIGEERQDAVKDCGIDNSCSPIYFETHCEVVKVENGKEHRVSQPGGGGCGGGVSGWPLAVTLSNGRVYGVDWVVSAIGVEHTNSISGDFCRQGGPGSAGAILVNEMMQTSAPAVFAAGDACAVVLAEAEANERQWFQMRLWSQARQQGAWAAHCMLGSHGTQFTGFTGTKVQILTQKALQSLWRLRSSSLLTRPTFLGTKLCFWAGIMARA